MLTNAELKLKITEKDSQNLNSYMVNNNLRNDLTSEIDGEYLNVKLINLSKENIILIANLDVEKQERLGNILTNILKFGGIGLGSLIVLIIFISIIKKIRRSFITTKSNKDRKNQQTRQRATKDKKDSDAIAETNMINLKQQKANEEFLNSLSKNSLLPQKPMQNLNNQNDDTQQLESNQNLSIDKSKIKKK